MPAQVILGIHASFGVVDRRPSEERPAHKLTPQGLDDVGDFAQHASASGPVSCTARNVESGACGLRVPLDEVGECDRASVGRLVLAQVIVAVRGEAPVVAHCGPGL